MTMTVMLPCFWNLAQTSFLDVAPSNERFNKANELIEKEVEEEYEQAVCKVMVIW